METMKDGTVGYPTDGYFRILDTLRDSGQMNMYGAPRWLENEFGLPRDKTIEIFELWTQDVERRHAEEQLRLEQEWQMAPPDNDYDIFIGEESDDPQEYK